MCGRFYIDEEIYTDARTFADRTIGQPGAGRRLPSDVYPDQTAPILSGDGGEMVLSDMRWGFPRPSDRNRSRQSDRNHQPDPDHQSEPDHQSGRDRQKGNGLYINARAETALVKPTFRDSVRYRRCIIPARHFYEWDPEKNKVTFLKENDAPMYMAGFYDLYDGEDRFVILTTQANPSVSPVHPRMPLILERDEVKPWIFSRAETPDLLDRRPGELLHQQEYEQQRLFD